MTTTLFAVLGIDGREAGEAEIPDDLTVSEVTPELAARVGLPPEPDVSDRYTLWYAPPGPGGSATADAGAAEAPPKPASAFVLLRDEQKLAELPEGGTLRVAFQPRPAARHWR